MDASHDIWSDRCHASMQHVLLLMGGVRCRQHLVHLAYATFHDTTGPILNAAAHCEQPKQCAFLTSLVHWFIAATQHCTRQY